ncbi:ubiquinol-cytochrome c reductase iron-sulfur subunit [Pseudoxanthomonas sp. SGNA-20]|uniref:Ubiquinol-cytochrome c reductase iron-sulfur subunit n=1 Tax=Pseudoxanthomonas taiwanensis J19 TaxID=935569 RepID=A0A562DL30_9GAMM|nr:MULTISPECIES: ubiquinol-cytochrome c reductase iron-sulfur subunit [Pseudoxanthomonas]RRN58650.1 ubiquinol-cytochrome c reductase iron-sulfur subunit [Pseudoxanthomonas sp. SGNA-20]RRN80636.1 ubiquinol-cytochrome c reductase iron-sulfur subunit [Pseudoxanthomonas sp. SGD-10]TWH10382.1 ubiquinol-cytochrome c reductase iron-sulfur subunit [Pseudoxanthomonas taiwanensis J19]
MANDEVQAPVNTGRRRFLTATTAVVGAVGAGFAAVPFIKSWNPSARAKLAGAPVTADISALQEGQRLILEWRGQPIWIVKRSKAVLDALPTLDGRLRDPQSENPDQQPEYVRQANPVLRSLKPEISVLVGLCTHLGCSPEMAAEIKPEPYDPEWKGGYFCPCHKSRFDMAGRVFQGVPAPTNLVVPPHHYADDNTIVIGVDPQGA